MSFESALFLRAVNDLVAAREQWIAEVAGTSRIKDEKEKKVEHDVDLEEYDRAGGEGMKAPRRKVVAIIYSSRWQPYGTAILECSHQVTVGRYRRMWPKFTRCTKCLAKQEEKE